MASVPYLLDKSRFIKSTVYWRQYHSIKTLQERILFIKKIAETQKVETLILGAYGCGVFKQDANVVAKFFKEAFKETSVKTIIYAVPKGADKRNYEAFVETFK